MKRKSVIELLGVVAVACSLFGCNKQVKEKENVELEKQIENELKKKNES